MIEAIISGILIGVAVFGISYYYLSYRFECILRKIAMSGASLPEKAVKPEEAGITSEWDKIALNRLVKEGKLVMTEDGRYYLKQKENEEL